MVEVAVVEAVVEVVLEEFWARVGGAGVVGGGSKTRGGIRGEKYVLLRRSELQRGPWQQEPLSVNPGPVTPSRVQVSSSTQPRTGKDTVTLAARWRHRKVIGQIGVGIAQIKFRDLWNKTGAVNPEMRQRAVYSCV